MKKIRSLVKKASSPAPPEEIGKLKGKLEKCRNPALTDERLLVFVDDDDDTISITIVGTSSLLTQILTQPGSRLEQTGLEIDTPWLPNIKNCSIIEKR